MRIYLPDPRSDGRPDDRLGGEGARPRDLAPPAVRRAAAWAWAAHALVLLVAERTGARLDGAAPALLAFAVAAAVTAALAGRAGRRSAAPAGGALLVLVPTLWSAGFLYSYTLPHDEMLTTQGLVLLLLVAAPFAIRRGFSPPRPGGRG